MSAVNTVGASASAEVFKVEEHKADVLHGIKLRVNVILVDEYGNKVAEVESEGRSFLRNFFYMLRAVLTNAPTSAVDVKGRSVDISLNGALEVTESITYEGSPVEVTYNAAGFFATAPKEDDSHGIVVYGQQFTYNPYTSYVEGQIKNDVLRHFASIVYETTWAGNTAGFTISRTFINVTSDTVVVYGIGLIVKHARSGANILVIVDNIQPIGVAPNYGLVVRYQIQVSV